MLPKKWGWRFTIDCTDTYDSKSPESLLDAVITAAEVETLVPFIFKGITYNVRITDVSGERLTGDGKLGTYEVFVEEPV